MQVLENLISKSDELEDRLKAISLTKWKSRGPKHNSFPWPIGSAAILSSVLATEEHSVGRCKIRVKFKIRNSIFLNN